MGNNIIDREKLYQSGLAIAEFLDETSNPSHENNVNYLQYIRMNIHGINQIYGDVLNSKELETKIDDIVNTPLKAKQTMMQLLDYIIASVQAYDAAEGNVDAAAGLILDYIQTNYTQQQQGSGADLPILTSNGFGVQTGAITVPQAYHDGNLTDYAKTGAEVTTGATSVLEEEIIEEPSQQKTEESINSDLPTASTAESVLSDVINGGVNNPTANTVNGEIIEGEELEVLSDNIVDNDIEVLDEDEGLFDFGKGIIKTNTDVTKTAPTKVKKSALGIGGGVLGIATMAGAGVMAKKYNDKKEKRQDEVIAEEPKKEEEKEQRKIMSIEDIYEFDKDNKELEEATTNDAVGSDFFNMNS